jgi:hypothetical protein
LGGNVLGVLRFPRNLIIGVRSAWAAEARRALVANILQTETDQLGRGSRQKGRNEVSRDGDGRVDEGDCCLLLLVVVTVVVVRGRCC